MSSTLNKVLGIVIILFIITTSIFYVKNNSLQKENIQLSSQVTTLESNVKTLSNENTMLKTLQSEADQIIIERNNSQKELTSLSDKTKGELYNIEKRKETTNVIQTNSSSNTLDTDVTRLLNELCERVRGSTCPASS